MEQVRDRRKFIGASDVAGILGVSPWKTPIQVWEEKTGRAKPEPISKARERAFARGKKLEPYVIEMMCDKLEEQGNDVELIATNKVYTDPEYDFLQCEIDAEIKFNGTHVNVDAKTVQTFMRKEWGHEDTDEMPVYYSAQFMDGMMITDKPLCIVGALIGLDDIAIYYLQRDDDIIKHVRSRLLTFWHENVLKDVAPEIMVFDDVKRLYNVDNGAEIEATPDIASVVYQLKDVKKQIKDLEEKETELKLEVGRFIAPAATLMYGGKKLATFQAQNLNTFQSTQFKEDYPDLSKRYTNHRFNRVLRLK
jgi:putative phage-type endonuclease